MVKIKFKLIGDKKSLLLWLLVEFVRIVAGMPLRCIHAKHAAVGAAQIV